MNLADAIRQAASSASAHRAAEGYEPPNFQAAKEAPTVDNTSQQPTTSPAAFQIGDNEDAGAFDFAVDAVTSEPVPMPEGPTQTVRSGNVVRLELFLSPEQLNQLFRALVATQHGMLTLREAAQYLRVHPNTVEQMALEGSIPGLQIEGRWRFPKSSLDEWLNLQVFKKGEANAA